MAQSQPIVPAASIETPAATLPVVTLQDPDPPTEGATVRGTVLDGSGAVVANVKIVMAQPGVPSKRQALSDGTGYFVITNAVPGPFELSFSAPGFAPQEESGVLHPGEEVDLPAITLAVARTDVDVDVMESSEEVAEDQIKVEEKQRVLGIVPNYYVSYVHNAAPLTTKLKFQLAWKSTVEPVSFALTAAGAGIQQAENSYSGYGQGMQGYAKRYGAAYGTFVSGTFIGGAILPSLLKQDPRYFWKGTGSRTSRVLYAIANSVICRGDNGRWQPNYSAIIGGLAAGGISNLYYPPQNRDGATLTFENAAIGTAFGAAGNIIEEFFLRRLTPHVPNQDQAKN
ncbi:MAG: carboxypeptidase-like regulatory domain-containing protein [Candidatus Sulfotelmatobacter sp.]